MGIKQSAVCHGCGRYVTRPIDHEFCSRCQENGVSDQEPINPSDRGCIVIIAIVAAALVLGAWVKRPSTPDNKEIIKQLDEINKKIDHLDWALEKRGYIERDLDEN